MKTNQDIQLIGYQPSGEYQLDLEIIPLADLRRRVDDEHFRMPQRIDFYMMICISKGTCTHIIDFKPVQCEPGTFLSLRPGQTQQFDAHSDWDGWTIIFRPEFLLPLRSGGAVSDMKAAVDLETLPDVLQLNADDAEQVISAIKQIHKDTSLHAASEELHSLIRHQLYAILLRLMIFCGQQEAKKGIASSSLVRFKRFQVLVEQNFNKWHQVADYANVIGCSEKSLTRAASDAVNMSAKAYIASRINLEAKRLLVHTAMPVGVISDHVGFNEATNFVKFFKRDVGCSPGSFRRQYAQSART